MLTWHSQELGLRSLGIHFTQSWSWNGRVLVLNFMVLTLVLGLPSLGLELRGLDLGLGLPNLGLGSSYSWSWDCRVLAWNFVVLTLVLELPSIGVELRGLAMVLRKQQS